MANHRPRFVVAYSATQAGQVGLIVVLMAVVVLTIGLSLFVRTTRQVTLSAQQEESARIFSAAETGVEKALANIFAAEQDPAGTSINPSQTLTLDDAKAKVTVQVDQVNKLETYLNQGDTAELRLATADPITILWSETDCSSSQSPASLIISVHNTASETSRFEAVKGQGCPEASGHNFTEGASGSSPYSFSYTVTLQADDDQVRVQPILAGTKMAITGAAISTAQFTIISKAQDNSGASQQAKAIEVKRTLSTPPAFMDYTVYSGSSIIK